MKRVAWMAIAWGLLVGALTARADETPVSALAQALKSDSEAARLEAALALFDLGPQAREAVPALAEALYSPQTELRILATATLARIGPDAAGAATALASRLDDPEEGVRQAALAVLESLGPQAEDALLQSLENGSSTARRHASALLEVLDEDYAPRVPVLVSGLREEDWSTQPGRARGRLEHLSVLELIRILRSGEDDTTRYFAISALGRKGPDARSALADVATVLREIDGAPGIRVAAAWTIGQMGPAGKQAEGALISALATDPYFAVRAHAAQALGKIGASSQGAVDSLVAGLSSDDSQLRGACAVSLWRMGDKAAPAVKPLTDMLSNTQNDKLERYFAAAALGAIGRPAAPAVPQLTALLSDSFKDLRGAAAFALGRIGPDAAPAIPALRKVADEDDSKTSQAAAHALARIEGQQKSSLE